MTIEIVSASAGSGKTYRLAKDLADAVVDGTARPEAVLATTFTNKAAAELQERVRGRLLEAGHVDAAQRLGAARIGTVNAVCGRLVTEFAFELGLSPDLRVMDEEQSKRELRRAISTVLTVEWEAELNDLKARVPQLDGWADHVRDVVDAARSNGLSASHLPDCAQKSIDGFSSYFTRDVAPDGDAVTQALRDGIDAFLDGIDTDVDSTGVTKKALDKARRLRSQLDGPAGLPWAEWVRASYLKSAVKSSDAISALNAAAADYDRHPQFRADLKRGIELPFEIATAALEAYEARKRERGLIDFVDQETWALKLLRDPDLRERLAGTLDLVLVDEFQDTSPIQLAIFIELSKLAKRSIWVGDQKQAIYGFRGTDPALMDAVIETILGGEEPDTLGKSYRSRPKLVSLSSELFAPAFVDQDIPERRTRLEAALDPEPAGLGENLELWKLVSKANNETTRPQALAAGLRDLLADDTVKVRDRTTGDVRPVRGGDVGVLCRKHKGAEALAAELGALGVRAVIPRPGLLQTPEGVVALAGLRLWIDPRDSLARAELARWISYPEDPHPWFAALVETPKAAAFVETDWAKRIEAARLETPRAGPTTALQGVFDALELRARCAGWGDAETRLANLDALMAHARSYAEARAAEGAGATPGGLVAWFDELVDGGDDQRAVDAEDPDAVVVSTWHGAKGLEWPIVVLSDLHKTWSRHPYGVTVATDAPSFDLDAPLKGRWIRFWPWETFGKDDATELSMALANAPETLEATERGLREELRLLYVGWTRARDRLVLVLPKTKQTGGILGLLADDSGCLVHELEAKDVESLCGVDAAVREIEPAEPEETKLEPGEAYETGGPVEHPPAVVTPSSLAHAEKADVEATLQVIGDRPGVTPGAKVTEVGEAFHTYLAALRPEPDPKAEKALAEAVAKAWGVEGSLPPKALVQAGNTLRTWLKETWPDAEWHPEWPIRQRRPDGSEIRGSIDLLVVTPSERVVIDHKSLFGASETLAEKAAGFYPQLEAYLAALKAEDPKREVRTMVHLPLAGVAVRLDPGTGNP